jgi:hypothetical protein
MKPAPARARKAVPARTRTEQTQAKLCCDLSLDMAQSIGTSRLGQPVYLAYLQHCRLPGRGVNSQG